MRDAFGRQGRAEQAQQAVVDDDERGAAGAAREHRERAAPAAPHVQLERTELIEHEQIAIGRRLDDVHSPLERRRVGPAIARSGGRLTPVQHAVLVGRHVFDVAQLLAIDEELVSDQPSHRHAAPVSGAHDAHAEQALARVLRAGHDDERTAPAHLDRHGPRPSPVRSVRCLFVRADAPGRCRVRCHSS